ncbi:MAG: T9SS type A sorting domain-containing protein [Sporocytophaga sp.]|uniref:immunoglobulin domain-containing protein n=1 Tax=Sporocytophaga sp. TaxID=2231183 RepID=UPI001B01A4E3|nr:T9SS type A sorting domain-containing protein [Sporocytophaga sp.]MBO9700908.1 T9SS type A sorting domain-containing protein [Sporocytophaga sp.]
MKKNNCFYYLKALFSFSLLLWSVAAFAQPKTINLLGTVPGSVNPNQEYTFLVDETGMNICFNTGSWNVDAISDPQAFGVVTSMNNDRRAKVIFYNTTNSPKTVRLNYTGQGYNEYGQCGIQLSGSWTITVETCASAIMPITGVLCPNEALSAYYTGTGYTYEWQDAQGTPIAGATSNTFRPETPGYYRLKTTNSLGCSSNNVIQAAFQNTTPSSITTAGNTNFCDGNSVELNANTGAGLSYQWFNSSGVIANETRSSYTATASGDYYVQVKKNDICPSNSPSVHVVEYTPVATPVITPSGITTFCSGSSVVLTTQNQGSNFTYQWFKDQVAISGQTNISYTATETGSYTVQVSSSGGCGSQTSLPTSVTVSPYPLTAVIRAQGPTTVCAGTSVVLSTDPVAGCTYQWYGPTGKITGATNLTYTVTTAGWYKVMVISSSGCSSLSAGIQVIIQQVLPTNISDNISIQSCFPVSLSSKLNNPDSYGSISFQWYKNGAAIPNANGSSFTASDVGTFDYNYTINGTSVCNGQIALTSGIQTVTINDNLPLRPSLKKSLQNDYTYNMCSGGSVELTLNNPPSPPDFIVIWYKYSGHDLVWDQVGTGTSYLATTTGYYRPQYSNMTCANPREIYWLPQYTDYAAFTANVIINSTIPTAATVASGPLTFCKGGSVTLTANAGTDFLYQWTKNDNNIAGATTRTYVATETGNYKVIVSNNCNPSATSSPIAVQANGPTAVISYPSGANTTFCAGGSITLQANTGTGLSYQWYKNGTAITSATLSSYTATTSGMYSVKVTQNGCSATALAVKVTVNANSPSVLTANPPISNTAICDGYSLKLTSSAIGDGFIYQWNNSDGPIAGANESQYSVTKNGSYSVTVSTTNCGITKTSAAVPVTVYSLPNSTIQVTATDSDPTIRAANTIAYNTAVAQDKTIELCSGTVILNAPAVSGNTYQWSNYGFIQPGSSSTFKVTESGKYNVEITDIHGCVSKSFINSKPAKITINDATISAKNLAYCVGSQMGAVLSVPSDVISGTTFQWYQNEIPMNGKVGRSITVQDPGSYNVTFSNSCGTYTSIPMIVKKAISYPGQFVVSCQQKFKPGQTASVSYTACGVTIKTPNRWIVELSNPEGSFACNSTVIAIDSSAQNAGQPISNIIAIIPADVLPGNKYRIRVRSTVTPTIWAENGFDISILDEQGNQVPESPYYNDFLVQWTNHGLNIWGPRTMTGPELYYAGDFDADGIEELLIGSPLTESASLIMLKYDPVQKDWTTIWSNTSTTGIINLRDQLVVGNFDGLIGDEIVGYKSGYATTLFKFNTTTKLFESKWSDNPSHPMRPYISKMYAINLNGDTKDEILGCDFGNGGWTTTFEWTGSNFEWRWSDYGVVSSNPFKDYRDNLRIADFDGDGVTEIMIFGSSAIMYQPIYISSTGKYTWQQKWSSGTTNRIGNWTYPLASTDKIRICNLDGDAKQEILFYSISNSKIMTMDYDNSLQNWTTHYQVNSYIGNWPTNPNTGTDSKYLLVKAQTPGIDNLIALRKNCGKFDVAMYKPTTSTFNFRTASSADPMSESISIIQELMVYPNPSANSFDIDLKNGNLKTVYIYNSVGDLVYTENNIPDGNPSIHIKTLENGMYLVKVISQDNTEYNSKVLITK